MLRGGVVVLGSLKSKERSMSQDTVKYYLYGNWAVADLPFLWFECLLGHLSFHQKQGASPS
jgi:hypothetical protein